MKYALLIALSAVPLFSFSVWFAGDGFRVDAVTGNAFEANPVYSDYLKPSYKTANSVWNRKIVSLACARNEAVSFQIFVERGKDQMLKGINILISDLASGDDSVRISRKKDITLFRQWYLQVKEPSVQKTFDYFHSLGTGWWPDPLIPLDNSSVDKKFLLPVDLPSADNNIGDKQAVQAFWADVYVPEGVRPGLYKGKVTVQAQGKKDIVTPVELKVIGATLPNTNHTCLSGMGYGFRWIRTNFPHAIQGYFKLAKMHRIQFEPSGLEPEIKDGNIAWDPSDTALFNYDRIVGPALDGSLFTGKYGYYGPNMGMPQEWLLLPFHMRTPGESEKSTSGFPQTPYLVPEKGMPPLENAQFSGDFRRYLKECENHFGEKGWGRTKGVIFINDFIDEPRGRDLWTKPDGDKRGGYSYIKWFGDLINSAGLKDRKWVLFRNDLGDVKSAGEWIPGWNEDSVLAAIGGITDLFDLCGSPKYIPTRKMMQYTKEHNKQWMFYFSCTSGEPGIPPAMLDMETNSYALWSWISRRYGCLGGVHWNIMIFGGRAGKGGWETAYSGRGSGWNENPGDDCYGYYNMQGVFYDGRYIDLQAEPVPCIRLKSMRRGVQDYEYLYLLEQADRSSARADSLARIVVPNAFDDGWENFGTAQGKTGMWVHDPEKLDAVRKSIVNMLAAQTR